MNAAQLQEIAAHIRRKQCVPFLGAAANLKAEEPPYAGLPLGKELASALACRLEAEGEDPHDVERVREVADAYNLQRVSLIYELKTSRPWLIESVRGLLPDHEREPSLLLDTLAQLPFDLYVTTNYDRLLEKALAHRKPLVAVQTSTALEGADAINEWISAEDASRPPLIYKIHGSFREPQQPKDGGPPVDKSPLIITEDDYIELLTLLGSENQAVPSVILSRLAKGVLLFLGYSLDDWDFRVLYKIVKKSIVDPEFPPRAYSIQSAAKEYWRQYWQREDVKILDVDIYEFARKLRAEFRDVFPERAEV